jgi:hypothetical protein
MPCLSGLNREPLTGVRTWLLLLAVGCLLTLTLPSAVIRSAVTEIRKGLASIRSLGDVFRFVALVLSQLAMFVGALIPLMLLYSGVAWVLSWPLSRTTFELALVVGLLAFALVILAAFVAGDEQLHKWFWGALAVMFAILLLGQCELRRGGSSWDDGTCAVPRYC